MPPRADRGSTWRLGNDQAPVEVTICTPRVVRMELLAAGQVAGLSYVGPREWPGARVDVADGEPLRLATDALRVEATTRPLRLAFLDAGGAWLIREPGGRHERAAGGAARVRAALHVLRRAALLRSRARRRPAGPARPGAPALELAPRPRARARTSGCRCWSRAPATRSSSTIPPTPCSRWAARTAACASTTPPSLRRWRGTS